MEILAALDPRIDDVMTFISRGPERTPCLILIEQRLQIHWFTSNVGPLELFLGGGKKLP